MGMHAGWRWTRWTWVVAGGLLLGLGLTWLSVKTLAPTTLAVGPWQLSLLAGSRDADPYTRARVALGGLLALNRSETMYYLAFEDSAGQALRARCQYRITGAPPPARWWSLTAYADDHFLFADPQHRYSVNGAQAVLDAQGRFDIRTGPGQAGAERVDLGTPGQGGMVLALRVYNPEPALQAAPQGLQAPRIERQGDCA